MRRLLTFSCEGAALGGSLDGESGSMGLLIVSGGTQTRIGSHRMFERLAAGLAEAGYPSLRYDRRGVGDSEGDDPGFRGSGPDIAAAAAAFRGSAPGLQRMIGIGLCDGATALALFGPEAGLDAIILLNPWFVEAESGEPPPQAVKHHYRRRLLSLDGWKKLLTGQVSYRKLLKGVLRISASSDQGLASEIATALERKPLPCSLILASGDATAIAAEAAWNSPCLARLRARNPEPVKIASDAHTFSRDGDRQTLLNAVLAALKRSGGD